MEMTLTRAIADYIHQRKQTKLESLQKALNKVLDKSENAVEIAEAKAVYAEAAAPIEQSFEPEVWLTDAARLAKQISLATHAPKYIHSDAKSSSVLVKGFYGDDEPYLITAKIRNITTDFVGNSAVFGIAKLLRITVNSDSLITQLQNNNVDALASFTNNSETLAHWRENFKLALSDDKLASHTLSKQLYFPVKYNDGIVDYHLLCPLFSSSLAHKLYFSVTETRFGDSKEIRDARKSGKYHNSIEQSFPATAIQKFGGSKPQNISLLNTERYGQHYLLNAAPPQWQSQTKPPLKSKTLFNRQFNFKVSSYLREFKTFLENLRENERNFKVRYKRDQKFILPIIDTLFNTVVSIQLMQADAGWSNDSECQLKSSHCLWLDVLNPDEKFQQEREKGDWLEVVANDFASWLTARIKSDQYKLSDVEYNYFRKLCLQKLKRFERATPKLGEII